MDIVELRPDEHERLVEWLSRESWPFHVNARPSPEMVRAWLAAGMFTEPEARTFWVHAEEERAGLIRLHDLEDETPMFDLRLRAFFRGRGLGRQALRWLTRFVFTTMPGVERIEGTTRQDNVAMRRLFETCGFAKEAHYRRAWPAAGGERLDSIGYGILREDWLAGSVTPLVWDDRRP
jgi:RimJ/RimL family protein N-acetyltransferase